MPLNLAVKEDVKIPAAGSPAESAIQSIVAYVKKNGLGDSSLRQLARVANTSHRMLRYYFESREGVLGAIMRVLRQEEADLLLPNYESSRREAMERTWAYFTSPKREIELKIFFYLAGLAMNYPHKESGFLDAVVSTWTDRLTSIGISEGLTPEDSANQARLLCAAARGLALDRLLTDDKDAVDEAFGLLLDTVIGSEAA